MCDLGAQVDQLARSPRSKLAILRRDRAISPRVRASGCAFDVPSVARPRILGSLLEAAAHGLRNLPGATVCETA
jgi:hypothetical protein